MKPILVLALLIRLSSDWWGSQNNQEWLQGQVQVLKAKQVALHNKKPLYARLGIKPIEFVSTAYEAGPRSCGYWARFGRTKTGIRPHRGIVAVDPRVIPLHTKLYVENYGYAQAEDIGGAIKGRRIDLFMPTVHECLKWGRKRVKVYILPKETVENSSNGQ